MGACASVKGGDVEMRQSPTGESEQRQEVSVTEKTRGGPYQANGVVYSSPVNRPQRIRNLQEQLYIEFSQYLQDILERCSKENHSVVLDEFLTEWGSVLILCSFAAEAFESELLVQQGQNGENRGAADRVRHLMTALKILSKFLRISERVAEEVLDHGGLLPVILTKLKEWTEAAAKREMLQSLVRLSLDIIHQVAQYDALVSRVRRLYPPVSDVMNGYLASPDNAINKLSVIATLVDVMTEKEADDITEKKEMADFLTQELQSALHEPDRISDGWSATEVLKVIHRLGEMESFKRPIVEVNIITALEEGVRSTDEKERIESLNVVWILSFNEENVQAIMNNESLVGSLIQHYRDSVNTTADSDALRTVQGILWKLQPELEKSDAPQYKEIAQELRPKPRDEKTKRELHVMLSYQHRYQPLVDKIHQFLTSKKDLKVWMDKYNMAQQGSVVQAMAEAVEGAFVVVMCVSEGYKNSESCRLEAEYAHKLKKPLIPLLLEKDYEPDGWLGILKNNLYYHDFSRIGKDTHQFTARAEQIEKAIRDIRGRKTTTFDIKVEKSDKSMERQRTTVAKSDKKEHKGAKECPSQPKCSEDMYHCRCCCPCRCPPPATKKPVVGSFPTRSPYLAPPGGPDTAALTLSTRRSTNTTNKPRTVSRGGNAGPLTKDAIQAMINNQARNILQGTQEQIQNLQAEISEFASFVQSVLPGDSAGARPSST